MKQTTHIFLEGESPTLNDLPSKALSLTLSMNNCHYTLADYTLA